PQHWEAGLLSNTFMAYNPWLHLIVLVCIWNALKFFWIGPISLVLLARARIREATAARPTESAATNTAGQSGQLSGAHS
ncbi:hypothetical protein RH857_04140, partial [Nesterenkonia flava]|nr:hypothetical protein [Nesterenkonia flava]